MLIFLVVVSLYSFGQKIKYRDYKDVITLENYRETIDQEKYSPLIAGTVNYLFPCLGYFYVGEPIRGIITFSGQMLASSLAVSGIVMSISYNYETGESPKGARAMLFSGIIAGGLIQIWSIYDVIKIAKVKNLVYQENNITMDLKPDLFLLSNADQNSAIYGLKLSVRF